MDRNKHIWEGWTVGDFIDELDILYPIVYEMGREVSLLETKAEVKKWCMENQPSYKKHIPEVVEHFCNKFNIK